LLPSFSQAFISRAQEKDKDSGLGLPLSTRMHLLIVLVRPEGKEEEGE